MQFNNLISNLLCFNF